jgi:hypothetical protein
MKRGALLGVVSSVLLLAANCQQQGPGGPNEGVAGSGGKSSSSSSSSANSSGGQAGSGGAGESSSKASGGGEAGAGGESSSSSGEGGGGSSGGSAGRSSTSSTSSTPKGGSSGGVTVSGGAGGNASSGGSTEKGGSSGGGAVSSGGAGSGGATTSKASSTTGSGGGSTGGATGSGGTTGSGGSTDTLSPADIVPDLDGFYYEGTCSGNVSVSGKNCPMYDNGVTTCASGSTWDTRGTSRSKVMNVKGEAGKTYTINFEVRGVAGTRCYTNGKAASTATPSTTGPNNTWYVGGKQANDSIWNTYELHVSPAVTGEANVYFLNAFPANPDWCQKEATYQIGYTASFKVQGGGTMTFTIHDSNCQAQQNCGSNEGATTCDSPRSNVDLSGMSPAATFKQPPTNIIGAKTFYPQWLYFDVKSVTSP